MKPSDLLKNQMEKEKQAPMPQSPMDISDRSGTVVGEIDQKENLCSVQEQNLGISTKKRRNRNGGGFNLRKSLVWNQAFFTEEGVLDPMELSTLTRSSEKSSGSPLSVGKMTPLSIYNKSCIRPPLHDLITNSQSKKSKPRKLFHSSKEEPESHTISGKTPLAKSVCRNIPRSPASYSQKRVANTSTTNPTSKLPKFMPPKSHVPPLSPRNVMSTTKCSKSDMSAIKATAGRNGSVKQLHTKIDFVGGHGKNTVEDHIASLKAIPNRSFLTKHEMVACVPHKVTSFLQPSISQTGGPPAPVHARPSALRMPSPSLGFFCQGNVSSSSNSQHQRHAQPMESKIPFCRQPMNLRQNCQLQTLTAPTRQQAARCAATANSGLGYVLSTISQGCLEASFLKPPVAHDTYLHIGTNKEMKQVDKADRIACINSGSSSCRKDSEKHSGCNQLLVDQNIHKQHGVPLKKSDSDKAMELNYDNSSPKISKESFVEVIQQFPSTSVPEDVCDVCSPAESSNELSLSCSNESQEFREGDTKEIQGSPCKARNSYEEITETYPVSNENSRSEVLFEITSNLQSELTCRSIPFTESTEDKFFRKEEIVGSVLNISLELDQSLSPSSGTCGQVATLGDVCMASELNGVLADKCQSTHLEARELENCRSHSDSTNVVSSWKPDSLMPRENTCNDISREDVLLNVVPFSDEWVAALETLGEDILEKKTGRVQNSPPDKALPEPGPWSPVKKAQDIGPCDCTKYTKNNLTTSPDM